jgi:membrane protein DedA with SNARE-associated domain
LTASDPPPESTRPSRRRAALVITPIIVLVVCSNLGNAFFPTLVTEHPLLLIALTPTNRNFVLVASRVDPMSFYTVGFLRLLAPDPFFFLLGRWYGESAIVWMERRTPTFGQLMRTLERWFDKASWPLVTAVPNNPVCLLAGAATMSVALFAALDVIGTIGRLILLRVVGDIFSKPITWLVNLIGQYRIPLLIVTVTLVGFTMIREWRAGTSEIEQLLELEEELDELASEEHDPAADPDADSS